MKSLKELVDYLIKSNLSITTCESFTGGLLANLITNVANSSSIFKGGFVCYSNDFKQKFLKVNNRVIKKYGVVSKECAYLLAKNACKKTKANIGVSFTGNAGPTALENKEVGLAYICIYTKKSFITLEMKEKDFSRIEFKNKAIELMLQNIFIII